MLYVKSYKLKVISTLHLLSLHNFPFPLSSQFYESVLTSLVALQCMATHRLNYLLLFILGVIITDDRFGAGASCSPAAPLSSISTFILSTQADFHFD